MNRTSALALPLAVLTAGGMLAACSSGGGTSAAPTTPPAPTEVGSPSRSGGRVVAYRPVIDPAKFSSHVTNPYFPLRPGRTIVYTGIRDGKPQRTEMTISHKTRQILGVPCVVVEDVVTSNGALVEKTTDWYSQAANGDVWYFGENTAEYTNGVVSSTHGSWEAGVDAAQPGIIMKAKPKIGVSYRQEYRPGEAEDMAKVLRFDPSIRVPGGVYRHVLVTEDTNPLAPDKMDRKTYAAGIGLVHTLRVATGHREVSSYVKTLQG